MSRFAEIADLGREIMRPGRGGERFAKDGLRRAGAIHHRGVEVTHAGAVGVAHGLDGAIKAGEIDKTAAEAEDGQGFAGLTERALGEGGHQAMIVRNVGGALRPDLSE
jgi:hypothetical protein